VAEVLMGQLALSQHRFGEALTWGRAAAAQAPQAGPPMDVMADALIELGRYDDAAAVVQRAVDSHPGLSSYSRMSYLRELHGDMAGAIEAMQRAVQAGADVPENVAYVEVQLANLRLMTGDASGAERDVDAALALVPGQPAALAALASVRAAQGRLAEAASLLERAVDLLPLPAFVIQLGDVRTALGDHVRAAQAYSLAAAEEALQRANGVDVDQEMALFDADHGGDPAGAVEMAERAMKDRPSVTSADALSWALHRCGREPEALTASREARRLGSRNPLVLFHAGMIEATLGMTTAARSDLVAALTLDPTFSLVHAAEARSALASLGQAR
jgi:tetratricopeptide (TPR) repeat protein